MIDWEEAYRDASALRVRNHNLHNRVDSHIARREPVFTTAEISS
jgi:hypothetical protein